MPTTVFLLIFTGSAVEGCLVQRNPLLQRKQIPCFASQNPFTLTMRWADGVKETYNHHDHGIFIDARDGIWTCNQNATQGNFFGTSKRKHHWLYQELDDPQAGKQHRQELLCV